jgi:hypothetical protein
VISGFLRGIDENSALLGYFAGRMGLIVLSRNVGSDLESYVFWLHQTATNRLHVSEMYKKGNHTSVAVHSTAKRKSYICSCTFNSKKEIIHL